MWGVSADTPWGTGPESAEYREREERLDLKLCVERLERGLRLALDQIERLEERLAAAEAREFR